MKYKLVELRDLSGSEATIYSVIINNDEKNLFDSFLDENIEEYRKEVRFIVARLKEMGDKTGARENFFKHDEGKSGDGVCALYDDPKSKLRLYCIRYGKVAIILGGGGPKPKNIRAWQENPKLKKEVETMINVSKDITKRITSGDLTWIDEGRKLKEI